MRKLIGLGSIFRACFVLLLVALLVLPSLSVSPIQSVGADTPTSTLQDKYNQSSDIKSIYSLTGTTLSGIVSSNPKDEIKVTIGSSKSTSLIPELTIERWGEVSFSLIPNWAKLTSISDNNIEFIGNKVQFSTPNVDYSLYQPDTSSFEYNIILKSKPSSNSIDFDFKTTGLNFFYQPPLTEEYTSGYSKDFQRNIEVSETQVIGELTTEEIKSGMTGDKGLMKNWILLVDRPDNIVGSYVVYASSPRFNYVGGTEYGTGKVGQFYRPLIVDAVGKEVFGTLSIDTVKGILSVTIPQSFIDSAVYPISQAAGLTFGMITKGGTTENNVANRISSSVFTSPSGNNTASSISWYLYMYGSSDTGSCAIYEASNMSFIGKSVRAPESGNAFLAYNLATPVLLTGSTNYYLVHWGGLAGRNNAVYYDTVANLGLQEARSYGALQIPLWDQSWTTGTSENRSYSIYCTYVATPQSVLLYSSNLDTAINQSASSTNYGSSNILEVQSQNANRNKRSILQFSYPSDLLGKTISSAKLYLCSTSPFVANTRTYWIYRLTNTSWSESTSTWNISSTGTNWGTAGGDYTATNGASTTGGFYNQETLSWDVTAQVQYAVSNSIDISFLLRDGTESQYSSATYNSFYSNNESTHTGLRPQLYIEYGTYYTLSVTGSPGAGGTPTFTGSSPFISGSVVNISCNVSSCYNFNGWTPTGNITDAALCNTSITMLANASLTANYVIKTYTLTYTNGSNGTINGTTPQTINCSANGSQVTAVPNGGYVFVNWSDSVATAARTDTNIVANLSVTANFALGASVIAITNDPSTWTINGITGSGYIDPNITYYSNPLGDLLSPGATVNDSVCYFTVTNSSSNVPLDLTVTFGNFSGGDTMTNSNLGSNGATTFGVYAWYSGMTYSNKVIAKDTGSSVLYDEWTGSTLKWGVEIKTRSDAWTNGNISTASMTITAIED